MASTVKETDPLDHLEERIQKAVALVSRLRDEKDAAGKAVLAEKEAAAKAIAREKEASARAAAEAEAAARTAAEERDAAARAAAEEKETAALAAAAERQATEKIIDALRVDLEEAQNANQRLSGEIEGLREERHQVRTRLEKLLTHIDQLGAA